MISHTQRMRGRGHWVGSRWGGGRNKEINSFRLINPSLALSFFLFLVFIPSFYLFFVLLFFVFLPFYSVFRVVGGMAQYL